VFARRTISGLAKRFTDLRPDVLHVNKQNLEDGLDLLIAADRARLPVVSTVHVTRKMSGLGSMFGSVRDWVARRTLRRIRGEYIAVAEAARRPLAEVLSDREGVHHTHAVCNGITKAMAGDRKSLRTEWKCRPEEIVL